MSVRASTVAIFVRFWWNFAEKLGSKSKNAFVRGQNSMTPDPILPQFFSPPKCILMGKSKYRSSKARRPIVAVKSWKDVPREQLEALLQDAVTPSFSAKTETWGWTHFQWEYAWLNVWHIISQQRCEIERLFQRTTYRKPHIRSPMVTWPMTSRDPKRSRSWPQCFWSFLSLDTVNEV